MCGIAGIFHAERGRPVPTRLLAAMAAIQRHRGPDGYGVYSLERRGVGFGHARLSIIDLDEDRARQPFYSAEHDLLIAHNGEFYDYQRIRARQTALGARFRSKSDSELVLHLYPRLGLDATLDQLRGEFAFALYDGRADRLFLVRDRFGIKPLYYAQFDGSLVFGSEIKVILSHPSAPRRMDPHALYHQMMQTMVPGSTAFAGVHQVEPGQVVIVERKGGTLSVRTETYWDVDFPRWTEERVERDDAHYIEGVRDHLLDAVQLRLEADVPVGCYLSGGIDSCSIAGLAAACQQTPVTAFTIGFDDAAYDETALAREMAEATSAEHDILSVSGRDLYNHLGDAVWHAERTIYNTFAVAKLLLSQRVNDLGFKVVVTGEGSDELFAGYPSFRQDMYTHGLADMDPARRAELEAALQANNELFSGSHLAPQVIDDPALTELIGFTPSCLQPWLAVADHVPPLLAGHIREALADYSPGRAIAERLDRDMLSGRHPLDRAQYTWIKTQFESQVLSWSGDRMDMANAVEARPAFLDHHLVEFATKIPPRVRIRGLTEKYVLREAMRGLLPKALYEREKFAFMAPPAHTDDAKLGELHRLTRDVLSPRSVRDAGLLDPDAVESLVQRVGDPDVEPATRVQLDALVNHALCVHMLHRRFVAEDLPATARDALESWEASAPDDALIMFHARRAANG